MLLIFADALLAQRTIRAPITPFKTVVDFAALFIFQATTLGVFLAGRTNRLALANTNREGLAAEFAFGLRRGLDRTDQLLALRLSLGQLLRRNVGPVDK